MIKLFIVSRNISLFNELEQNTRRHKICILVLHGGQVLASEHHKSSTHNDSGENHGSS